jgi:hypothetical protein
MGGHTFPAIHCKLCNELVHLHTDLYADEHGQAVHEDCYVKRLSSEHSNSSAAAIEGSEPAA